MLPTWALQHYAALLPRAAPPLVLRVWCELKRVATPASQPITPLAALARRLAAPDTAHPQFFGVKAPHFFFGTLAASVSPVSERAAEQACNGPGGGGARSQSTASPAA